MPVARSAESASLEFARLFTIQGGDLDRAINLDPRIISERRDIRAPHKNPERYGVCRATSRGIG